MQTLLKGRRRLARAKGLVLRHLQGHARHSSAVLLFFRKGQRRRSSVDNAFLRAV
jgi:hypothetical protein